ncbi:MAG TPA: hypothetical protein VND87_18600 [Stellaceae bacterium]|nr:hypothetical protein [Stellaceae bacterium]
MPQHYSTAEILNIETIADLAGKTVDLIFHQIDGSSLTIHLPKRGIFDVRAAIDDLLRQAPEIYGWKSSLPH